MEEAMKKPNNHDADLLLRLYDMRREAVLRDARKFVTSPDFVFGTYDEMKQKYPQGSQGATYIGMVLGYWDMVCALVDQGLLNEELFFTTTYEHTSVWEKLKSYVVGGRITYGAPWWCSSYERVVAKQQAWMKAKSTPAKKAARRRKK
jgi:hypothetical protein